jgi:hypothetical protein
MGAIELSRSLNCRGGMQRWVIDCRLSCSTTQDTVACRWISATEGPPTHFICTYLVLHAPCHTQCAFCWLMCTWHQYAAAFLRAAHLRAVHNLQGAHMCTHTRVNHALHTGTTLPAVMLCCSVMPYCCALLQVGLQQCQCAGAGCGKLQCSRHPTGLHVAGY